MACLAVATFALFAIDEPRSKSCSNNQGGATPPADNKGEFKPQSRDGLDEPTRRCQT
jgi:hypothetical protein